MTVELIPVLEISDINQHFNSTLNPYLADSPFYKLTDIDGDSLINLTKNHTKDLRSGKYSREQASAFFGGYILSIDGQDKFFPQCCGTLSDILYWEQTANGNEKAYYEGHPQPTIKIKKDIVTFDFSTDEYDEPFKPMPADTFLQVDRNLLVKAVELAKEELKMFTAQVKKINVDEQLDLEDIDKLLVWGNIN